MRHPLTSDMLWQRVALLPLLFVLLVAASVEAVGLQVAGGDSHAWFLVLEEEHQGTTPQWVLLHHGRRDEPEVYHAFRRLDQEPAGLAALDKTAWLIFTPRPERPGQIPVRVLRVEWSEGIDRYFTEPRSGLSVLPDIRTDPESPAVPVDMVATSTGPSVLLEHADGDWSLQRFRRGRWEPVLLPSEASGDARRLGTADDRLVLLIGDGNDLDLWWQDGTDWDGPTRYPSTGPLAGLATVGDRLVISTRPEPGTLSLAIAQADGAAALGSWSQPMPPEPAWQVLGFRGRPGLVKAGEELEVSMVDPLTGQRGPWRPFMLGSPLAIGLWPVLVAFAASAVVLLILLRGRPGANVLPAGLGPLPPMTRLLALFIDAIPGLLVVLFWGEGELRLLMDAILLSLEPAEWVLYATMVGITCGWSLAWELLAGTSPGKILVGGRLVQEGGARPSWRRLIVRTLLKGLILLLPVLAVTALRPPNLQSAADQAARIIVVRPAGQDPEDTPGD